ncbi:molybdopterin-guanine dinucleotide biosynthesis protein B [Gottfriedia solisilvae]|uniref:Molybdopterin-guanine dinucleotide biosynthesis protein MobB n=1 Tax=Gottfriedia solisilvae TaxID=1516104 RepID=A0A8J3F1Y2_9BACI|nr:molybdopterin-guanine dinucleotide biosynthesis protein B [Gottfriedia solisilvae]GGI17827.1 molybdopterin-guanine dinucleotide biosynthesis protein MobB [Gottfriedia solisilvae]
MDKESSILQIVGFQNSGKTTLIEKLINKSNQNKLVTATIKHHGHGGTPDGVITSKDSSRHLDAGAIVSSVEGDGVLQLRTNFIDWNLEKTIQLYRYFSADLIIIEGYKQENYPKVVLIRSEFDLQLLDTLSNIKCVISHVPLENHRMKDYHIFHLHDEEQYVEYLMNIVLKKKEGGD